MTEASRALSGHLLFEKVCTHGFANVAGRLPDSS